MALTTCPTILPPAQPDTAQSAHVAASLPGRDEMAAEMDMGALSQEAEQYIYYVRAWDLAGSSNINSNGRQEGQGSACPHAWLARQHHI
jgi:hypothetical protein